MQRFTLYWNLIIMKYLFTILSIVTILSCDCKDVSSCDVTTITINSLDTID